MDRSPYLARILIELHWEGSYGYSHPHHRQLMCFGIVL